MKLRLLGFSLVLASSLSWAEGTQLNLQMNSDAIRVALEGASEEDDSILLSSAYHYSQDEGSLISLGAKLIQTSKQGTLSLGIKYVGVDPKDASTANVVAIGVGYAVPLTSKVDFTIDASFAPDVLVSGGSYESYADLNALISYQLMPQATLDLGYKAIRLSGGGETVYFDKHPYIGVTVAF